MRSIRISIISLLLSFVMIFTSFTVVMAGTGDEGGSETQETVTSEEQTEQDPCASGHTWGEWTGTEKATYFAEGKQQRTCTVCGTEDIQTIAKLSARSKWVKKDGKYYYFDKNGKLVTGWYKLRPYGKKSNAVKWCYFKSGKFIKKISRNTASTWVTAGGKKFYFTSKKKPAAAGYHAIGTKVYYMGEDKSVKTGTFKDADGNVIKARKDGSLLDGYAYRQYILIDISDQTLKLYKNYKLKMSVNVVTGLRGKHDTPTGIYRIQGKTRNTNLVGSTWNVKVSYWMPFYGGYGIHDATWRSASQFNKKTYVSNGSHGCVNMKFSDAKKLYNKISVGTVVIVRK